jgi:hypothetical protein
MPVRQEDRAPQPLNHDKEHQPPFALAVTMVPKLAGPPRIGSRLGNPADVVSDNGASLVALHIRLDC